MSEVGSAFRANPIGEEQCDFCGGLLRASPEVWTHFATPGAEYGTTLEKDGNLGAIPNVVVTRQVSNPDRPTTVHFMDTDGEWAACRDCHVLICAYDTDALVTRAARVAVDKLLAEYRGLRRLKARQLERFRAEARVRARQAHDGFFLFEDKDTPPLLEVAYTLTGWPYRANCGACGHALRMLHSTSRKAVYECDGCHRVVEADRG